MGKMVELVRQDTELFLVWENGYREAISEGFAAAYGFDIPPVYRPHRISIDLTLDEVKGYARKNESPMMRQERFLKAACEKHLEEIS